MWVFYPPTVKIFKERLTKWNHLLIKVSIQKEDVTTINIMKQKLTELKGVIESSE